MTFSALGQPEIVLVGYSEWKIEMMKMKMPPTTVKVTYIDLMERIKRSGLCRGIRGKDAKKLETISYICSVIIREEIPCPIQE